MNFGYAAVEPVPCLDNTEVKGTVSKIRALGKYLQMYAEDHDGLYPHPEGAPVYLFQESFVKPNSTPFTWSTESDLAAEALAPFLHPQYMDDWALNNLMKSDWNRKIYYAVSSNSKHSLIYTYGADGRRDSHFYFDWPDSPWCEVDRDIVAEATGFISVADGITRGN
jgi:hypothetical protein